MVDDSMGGRQPSDADVISLAREAFEASRKVLRQAGDGSASSEMQQPGITVDLGHKNIARLPDEVIDIIKDEIERLAIAHNMLFSFPPRLAECKRLRYLNVRYNALTELPKPVLELASLEILDISRNRLRTLPREIRKLTSLKVLAIQRNEIEKLPLSLGEMSSLRVLKFADNPLTFPPREVYTMARDLPPTATSGEREAHVTSKVKKFLKQQALAAAASNRQRLQFESDSEMSEGTAETPRPPKPNGRFPVRPSVSGSDAFGMLSRSPESPPPIPIRSHARMTSSQNSFSSIRRPTLLSPPDAGLNGMDRKIDTEDRETNLRPNPKRHGMITPRVSEAPVKGFPLVRTPPGVSSMDFARSPPASGTVTPATSPPYGTIAYEQRYPVKGLIEAARGVYTALVHFSQNLERLGYNVESAEQGRAFSQLTSLLRAAFRTAEALNGLESRRASTPVAGSTMRVMKKHLHEYLRDTQAVARYVAQHTWLFCVPATHDSYRSLMWDLQRVNWEAMITNVSLATAKRAHRTETGAFVTPRAPRRSVRAASALRPRPEFQPPAPTPLTGIRNTQPSPDILPTNSPQYLAALKSGPSTVSSGTSTPQYPGYPRRTPRTKTSQGQITQGWQSQHNQLLGRRLEDVQAEMSESAYEPIYQSLREVELRCREGLERIKAHFLGQRQELAKGYRNDSDARRVVILQELVSRAEALIRSSNHLSEFLDDLRDNAWAAGPQLNQVFKQLTEEWSSFIEVSKTLGSSQTLGDIKALMKHIHIAVKEASVRITNSPWAAGDASKAPSVREVPFSPSASSFISSLSGSMSGNLPPPHMPHNKQGSLGSVPSTPLGAALGPAALATLPNSQAVRSNAQAGVGGKMNVFERAERLLTSQQRRY
ncbi:hypothetical protein EJ06DRAFT_68924 [Trichodelitschia bisporula]|uniref:Disease resistance R13L4/SHOC-2-like LRR domain-containing protein n=1 Tax=Trichodelitschia bisporula TaxID=703511 RepID=A0A6G1HT12_9PEZI|nr:hypothetical protein EJ06DRAFT_68924 [Trichodelitschia bisporula]